MSRLSNLVFALTTLVCMVTVVHELFSLQIPVTLETRIMEGGIISDSEIPEIAAAKRMHQAALAQEDRIMLEREIEDYAGKFSVNTGLARLIYDISIDEGLEPELVLNIIWQESRFKTDAIGKAGEIGLMQIKYGTALCVDPGATHKKLLDPAYNIRIGIKHLKDQLHFFRGNTRLALLAYNRGRGKINSLLSDGINPSNGYAARILGNNF
ncbi:MAG: transglycosylase SLT domain-containing protein [Candidatus Glassbacteria bacterium]|nr:transglycosylase SLT domain-containing protein [Candidatus Glassbacteria bacterium]